MISPAIKKVTVLLIMFFFLLAIYSFGITGSLFYDDFKPLGSLENVTDIYSALFYVFTETSGPLGRPVSMLTFLLHANHGPENTEYIFFVNSLIHAFNALLVFVISYYLASFYCKRFSIVSVKPFGLALLVAIFWAVLPIHVSSSLIAIQRMTTLSAFFVLSGIALYLYGLHKQYLVTYNILL